jgi:hypothetical protein
MASFLAFGLAPTATSRGYAIAEIRYSTRALLELEYKDRDVLIVYGPQVHGCPDQFEFAVMAVFPETLDIRLAEAEKRGVVLSALDKFEIKDALESAASARRKSLAASRAAADPLNKGKTYSSSVGFLRKAKRANFRENTSDRLAMELARAIEATNTFQKKAESLLNGIGTETIRATARESHVPNKLQDMRRLLESKPVASVVTTSN